jgi:hypothetical protein
MASYDCVVVKNGLRIMWKEEVFVLVEDTNPVICLEKLRKTMRNLRRVGVATEIRTRNLLKRS